MRRRGASRPGCCSLARLPPHRVAVALSGPLSSAQISYNNDDRAAFSAGSPEDCGRFYDAIAAFEREVSRHAIELPLRPGTMLFIDNWRVLHGRREFTGRRRLSGCYLPHDDLASALRQLDRHG